MLKICKKWLCYDEKTVHGVETHRITVKPKLLGVTVIKECYGDSLSGYTKTHLYKLPCKKCNYKQFLIANSFGKIHLIYSVTLMYSF